MGFLSFHEAYYRQKLASLESGPSAAGEIYEARQLLKLLDDLADEGYLELNRRMEDGFACLTRLRALLDRAGVSPFPVSGGGLPQTAYGPEEYELTALLDSLIDRAAEHPAASGNPFLRDICDYSSWIGREADTAYIFLLRDTLLPYVFYRSRGYPALYPWLISRRFLWDVTGIPYVDDAIRLPVYDALEAGHTGFDAFSAFCVEKIRSVLDKHMELKELLLTLLRGVPERNIVVVESGYAGTIPWMLRALDERVSFRLYTTAPYLYETYRDRIFCRRYEDIRKFETLYAQDLLLRYASFRGGRFYVNVSGEQGVLDRSMAEIKYLTEQSPRVTAKKNIAISREMPDNTK